MAARHDSGRPEGWVVAAVALVFLLGTGVLGYLLVSPPRDPAPAAASTPAGGSPGAGAPAADPRLDGVTARLRGVGYRVTTAGSADGTDCAANAYGQSRAYLGAHRCLGLHRALLEVQGQRGGSALLALAWVGMADETGAAGLKTELDRPGSGNIVELSKEDDRYRNVAFNGIYYASARQAATVVTAEAQPIAAGLTAAQLKNIAAAAVR
ncbi:MAG TPA: hypothetical protein VGP05_11450 [Pseudonocardia sp.]|nr:hypothetical protein [Pseudonocardia sp.]